MRNKTWSISFVFLLAFAVRAQPGNEGTLAVNVIDSAGSSVRGAMVAEGPRQTGQGVFIGRIFPTTAERDFKRLFRPRDETLSSFIAPIYCVRDSRYSLLITAPGYEDLNFAGTVKNCQEEINVTLKRNFESLSDFEKLSRLSGRLTIDDGRPIRRFLIVREGKEYVPKVGANGSFSVQLSPGLYEIVFDEPRCTQYRIKDLLIGTEPRTLDLTANCSN